MTPLLETDQADQSPVCSIEAKQNSRTGIREITQPDRFRKHSPGKVIDQRTGLLWSEHASPAEFPLTWTEAFEFVEHMNKKAVHHRFDWRLPHRRELFSLVSHVRINPALPANHLFREVFSGYYWTADPCARLPRQAWYVHFGGGRVFKGMKHGSYMVWPVCHKWENRSKPVEPRFKATGDAIGDRWTKLKWTRNADPFQAPMVQAEALTRIAEMNRTGAGGCSRWRLPNIRELESLIDITAHRPALPVGHPFENVRDAYWTSTISAYDVDYSWAIYMEDGAVGVGHRQSAAFFTWPVTDG